MALVSDIEIRLRADIARLQNDMTRARRSVDGAMGSITQAVQRARNAFIGLAAGIGVRELANLTDGYTKFTAQLKLATSSQQEYARAVEDVKRISTTAQNDIATTGVLYARIIASTKTLGVSQAQVAKVTETVNLALAATAASATESSSAMLQLSQAFGSGVLRGEEFNAVNEAAPELLRILATSLGVPFGALRKLAEQGKLTSDILVKAFSDDKVIERLRANVAQITTISGALQVFKNNLMEVVGTQAHASGVVTGLTTAILAAAKAVGTLTAALGPALKIAAAYIATFVVAPALFQFTATAMGNLRLQIALAKLEMAGGATVASLFSGSLTGLSVSAQLAAGTLSKLTLATNLLFSAYAGWEIGKYLESQFVEVEIAAEVMTGELLKQWERIKHYGGVAFDGLTVLARETIATLSTLFSKWFHFVAKGMRVIGDDTKADALDEYADRIVRVTKVEGTLASRTAASRAEMEKNIKLIDLDTDRRSTAALMRVKISEADTQSAAKVAAAVKTVSEEEKKAAAQRAKAYADFSKLVDQRLMETAREAAGLEPLNEAQKLELDLKEKIADKTLVLTAAQEAGLRTRIAEIQANIASTESQAAYAKMLENSGKLEEEMNKTRADALKNAQDEVDANEKLVRTFGMSKAAIEQLELARLKEQLAQRSSLGLTLDEIEHLEQLIALKERSAKAVADVEALEETKRFWEGIEKTAHDTFVSIADGGKSAFQRLKETAKNIFFDWLYQQTLKKWIINIQAQGTGNPLQSLLGNNSLTAGSSLLKTIGSTVASYVVGSTLNKTISGGYETGSGFMAVQKIATAVGSVFSPVVGGIVGAVSGLINRAFGMKPKQYADASNLVGTLGTGGFSGTVNTAWTQKGGWFRSNKSGTDKAAVDLATASGLVAAYDAIKATSADFARVLGLDADSIANRTQALNIQLGKDEAANQKAIADFFLGVGDTIARELLPTIGQFQQAGESAADAFQRVATGFQVVDAMLVALSTDSQTAFRAVGVASLEARERLISLAGGIDALATQVQFFSDNFLTRAEQVAPLQKQVNEQLAALGYAGITTADQFKVAVQNLVNSGALATESGAKTYAALLQLGPMFKTVADYLAEVNEAAKQMLRDRADAAIETLGRSVDAQKDIVTKAYNDAMDALETRADALNETIERTASLSQALKEALRGVDTPANQAAARQAAQAQIGAALAIAKAGGVLPSADDLRDALATLQQDSTGQFSTLAAYQREVARTNAQLAELGGLSDDQLSIAERQLRALNEQRETSKVAYDMEIARLDGLLLTAQNELNAINGVNMSVLTVTAAVNQVQEALNALRTLPNPGTIGVPVAYAPPATKFEIPAPTYTAASGTMPSSQAMLNALQNMDTRLANMEISSNRTANATVQFAGQFDQSSGGGNALLVQQA